VSVCYYVLHLLNCWFGYLDPQKCQPTNLTSITSIRCR
jgi:hypothetical protein